MTFGVLGALRPQLRVIVFCGQNAIGIHHVKKRSWFCHFLCCSVSVQHQGTGPFVPSEPHQLLSHLASNTFFSMSDQHTSLKKSLLSFRQKLLQQNFQTQKNRLFVGQFLKLWLVSGTLHNYCTCSENLQRVLEPSQILTCEHSQLHPSQANFNLWALASHLRNWPLAGQLASLCRITTQGHFHPPIGANFFLLFDKQLRCAVEHLQERNWKTHQKHWSKKQERKGNSPPPFL